MKYIRDDRGLAQVFLLALVVVVLLVGAAAAKNYSKYGSAKKPTPVPKPSHSVSLAPTPTPTSTPVITPRPTAVLSPITEEDRRKIVEAVTLRCQETGGVSGGKASIKNLQISGDSAMVQVSCYQTMSGHVAMLKRVDMSWKVVFAGQEAPSKEIGEKNNLPREWY